MLKDADITSSYHVGRLQTREMVVIEEMCETNYILIIYLRLLHLVECWELSSKSAWITRAINFIFQELFLNLPTLCLCPGSYLY